MAKCVNITPKRKKLCVGALRNKIEVYDRDLVGVSIKGEQAHSEDYTLLTSMFASIETKKGGATQTLDGVVIDPELIVTHFFITRFLSTITAEHFVVFNNLVYKILKVENIDEANLWLRLSANLRGDFTKAGAQ